MELVNPFIDIRVKKNIALLFQRIVDEGKVVLRRIAKGRAEEVKFGRVLRNDNVSTSDLIMAELARTEKVVEGRHILGIQDTTEINFQSHSGRTKGLGTVGNGTDVGIFLHPLLAVDANTGAVLGFGAIHILHRHEKPEKHHSKRPIEEKESLRWLSAPEQSKAIFAKADLVTIIGDREGDIYEVFSRVPDEHTHVLNRVRDDRKLSNGMKLFEYLDTLPVSGEMNVAISREIRKGQVARVATCAIRHGEVTIKKPKKCTETQDPDSLTLRIVEIREENCPEKEEVVLWRLFTTHQISNLDDAKQIIKWYQHRWIIEQLFRTMKKQGLDIEATQVEDASSLAKLSIMALCAAVQIMQLVLARDGNTSQKTDDLFSDSEQQILHSVLKEIEGKTAKQKNPFPNKQLAWASWIIARLGGWKGYKSESPPGPITMGRGLEKFKSICCGWNLLKNVCIG